jgi:PAS domain S-box-containing protein
MQRHHKPSISSAFIRFTSILSTVSFLLLGTLWIGDALYHFEEDSRLIRQEFMEARKKEVKQEVDVLLAKVEDQRASLNDLLRNDIRARVNEAWSVADNLYRLNATSKSEKELAEMIREALRPIRYNSGRGYFFATGLDGIEQLFSDRPELEGHNLLDMTDSEGKPVIRDMIRIARQEGEGYYEYLWTKPGSKGDRHRKLAYIKYFPGLDWLIGTGEYLEDVENDLKEHVLRNLEYERFGDGGYFFAGTLDGISLAGPAKGQNMFEVTDANGLKIVQELVRTAKNSGGFVEYVLPAFENNIPHRKLSYVTLVEDWDWYIGAGVDIDAIEDEITRRHEQLWENTYKHSSALLAVLGLVLLLQYLIARRAMARLRSGLSLFMTFFKTAQEIGEVLVPESQPYAEMEELAHSANAMIKGRVRAEAALLASEARYRRLVNNATDSIFLADQSGRIVDANEQACRQLGYTHEELTAMHIYDVDAAATPDVFSSLQTALADANSVVIPGMHRRKDGSTFPVEIRVAAFTEHGQTFMLGIARDITERIRAQESLRQSEAKFVHLFQSSPDAILLVHLESEQIREVNEACVHVFGHSKIELLGRTTRDVGLFSDQRDRDSILAGLRKGHGVKNLEVTMRHKDGMKLSCLMSSQILNIEGEAYALSVYHDVTEQKKIQEMMIQSEKMISVGGIAAGIAHEINNPLGIVLQASQNLVTRTRPDFPKNMEVAQKLGLDLELFDLYMKERKLDIFIDDIREAGKRAAFIVRNMLDFSRRSETERRLCSMRDVAAKALSLAGSDYDLKKNYDFKRIRIEIIEDTEIPLVFCSETEIEQVFLNLLRNSAQAIAGAPEKIPDPRIVMRMSAKDDWVRIEIDDNGPGIPPEVLRRIFEPFFTTKKTGEGTGLGLSVSYFIITRGHGGRIHARSKDEGGTRFTIELPVTPGAAAQERE